MSHERRISKMDWKVWPLGAAAVFAGAAYVSHRIDERRQEALEASLVPAPDLSCSSLGLNHCVVLENPFDADTKLIHIQGAGGIEGQSVRLNAMDFCMDMVPSDVPGCLGNWITQNRLVWKGGSVDISRRSNGLDGAGFTYGPIDTTFPFGPCANSPAASCVQFTTALDHPELYDLAPQIPLDSFANAVDAHSALQVAPSMGGAASFILSGAAIITGATITLYGLQRLFRRVVKSL